MAGIYTINAYFSPRYAHPVTGSIARDRQTFLLHDVRLIAFHASIMVRLAVNPKVQSDENNHKTGNRIGAQLCGILVNGLDLNA